MGPGKTRDSNSNFAAKLLFDLGVDLKRIEVIADDEDEIVEAARRMVDRYDMVLTSGGIGPTHDGPSMSLIRLTLTDITYSSLAKAFDDDGKLEYHDETLRRMNEMGACSCSTRPNATQASGDGTSTSRPRSSRRRGNGWPSSRSTARRSSSRPISGCASGVT